MRLMTVSTPSGGAVWVACVAEDLRVYTYLHRTGMFHSNSGVYDDYFFQQDMSYEAVSPIDAVRLINSGVGKLAPEKDWVALRISQSGWRMAAEEVLGEVAAGIQRS